MDTDNDTKPRQEALRCKHAWYLVPGTDAELHIYWCRECGALKTVHGRFRESQRVCYRMANNATKRAELLDMIDSMIVEYSNMAYDNDRLNPTDEEIDLARLGNYGERALEDLKNRIKSNDNNKTWR